MVRIMGTNYETMLQKKQEKLDKLYSVIEDTRAKIKVLEDEINTLKIAHDAEQFGALKKDLAAKNYNVDAILNAIKNGKIDLSEYAVRQSTPQFGTEVRES